MKHSCLFLLLVVCAIAATTDASKWLRPPPNQTSKDSTRITEVFEVVASKVAVAIEGELNKNNFISLTLDRAKYFTGNYYRCPEGKKPYLVRSVYGFGGTGSYHVKQLGQSLLVAHESIGDMQIYAKSALVVNLDFEPQEVYVTSNVIE